jgi:hypothetical protein
MSEDQHSILQLIRLVLRCVNINADIQIWQLIFEHGGIWSETEALFNARPDTKKILFFARDFSYPTSCLCEHWHDPTKKAISKIYHTRSQTESIDIGTLKDQYLIRDFFYRGRVEAALNCGGSDDNVGDRLVIQVL